MSGKAVSDFQAKLDWKIAVGVQLPTEIIPKPDLEPVPVNDDAIEGKKFGLAADFVDEYSMVAEMRQSKGLEPCGLKEVRSGPDWLLLEKAIHEELAVLKAARTWELVDAPVGANIVSSKWVFCARKDATGNVV